jgi:hypothetical protein
MMRSGMSFIGIPNQTLRLNVADLFPKLDELHQLYFDGKLDFSETELRFNNVRAEALQLMGFFKERGIVPDDLVTGQIISSNPAHAVRGPRHSASKGATPVISSNEARELLDSMDTATVIGLRDRALVAVMAFTSRASLL